MRTRCCPAQEWARGAKVGIGANGRNVAPQARSKGCGEAKERTRWDRPTCAGSGNSRPATSAKTRAKVPTQMGQSVPGSVLAWWRRAGCMAYETRQSRFRLRNFVIRANEAPSKKRAPLLHARAIARTTVVDLTPWPVPRVGGAWQLRGPQPRLRRAVLLTRPAAPRTPQARLLLGAGRSPAYALRGRRSAAHARANRGVFFCGSGTHRGSCGHPATVLPPGQKSWPPRTGQSKIAGGAAPSAPSIAPARRGPARFWPPR